MTARIKLDERARALVRQILTEDFKQPASDEVVQAVARKVSRAMPQRTMAKLARREKAAAAAD